MNLVWQDWEEITKWQTDPHYIPSSYESVAHILVTCACVQFSQQFYAAAEHENELFSR